MVGGELGGEGAAAGDPLLGTLATLLGAPGVSGDQPGDGSTLEPQSPTVEVPPMPASRSGNGATHETRPVRVELAADDAPRPSDSRHSPQEWRIHVGRVEVNVEDRTPPPVAARENRPDPVAVASDPLEARFLERFRLRF